MEEEEEDGALGTAPVDKTSLVEVADAVADKVVVAVAAVVVTFDGAQ